MFNGDAGSFIVRHVVRAVWQKKPKTVRVSVAKVRGGSKGLALIKRRALVGQRRVVRDRHGIMTVTVAVSRSRCRCRWLK
jgi:hypothetical protein